MTSSRVIYQNWIAEQGFDPNGIEKFFETVTGDFENSSEVDSAVRRALEKLEEEEMEFVIRFYFMGQAYGEISEKSGRAVHKLEALHKRAIRKLRNALKAFVNKRYGIKQKKNNCCPVCVSPHRQAIDEVITNNDKSSTWRPVINEIYEQFGLKIKSPQTLIGHMKYH